MIPKRPDLATAQYQLLAERHQERAAFHLICGMSFIDSLRIQGIEAAVLVTYRSPKSDSLKEQKVHADKVLGTDWPMFLDAKPEMREQMDAGWLIDTADPISLDFWQWLLTMTDKPHYHALAESDYTSEWIRKVAQRVTCYRILERKLHRAQQGESGFADLEVQGRMQQMFLLREAVSHGARGANYSAKGDPDTARAVIEQFQTTCQQLLESAAQFPYQPIPSLVTPHLKEIA